MREENKVSGFSNWKKNFPSFEKLFSQIIERRIWEKRRLWEENKPPANLEILGKVLIFDDGQAHI